MKKQTKAYITNLGKFNEGHLVGQWLNVPCTNEEFQKALKNIGVDGIMYEEYFFTDFEYIHGLSEYSTIEEVNRMAEINQIINEITLNMTDENIKNEVKKELHSFVENLFYQEKLDDNEIKERLNNISIFESGINDALYNYAMYHLEQLDYLNYNELDDEIRNVLDIQKIGRNLILYDVSSVSFEKYENDEYKYIIIEN